MALFKCAAVQVQQSLFYRFSLQALKSSSLGAVWVRLCHIYECDFGSSSRKVNSLLQFWLQARFCYDTDVATYSL